MLKSRLQTAYPKFHYFVQSNNAVNNSPEHILKSWELGVESASLGHRNDRNFEQTCGEQKIHKPKGLEPNPDGTPDHAWKSRNFQRIADE
jgi:hypothetical protein